MVINHLLSGMILQVYRAYSSGFPMTGYAGIGASNYPLMEFNELIPKMAIFKAADTFSKAHHFGALQPLVFGGVDSIDCFFYML